jgi:hypothetical protein
MGGYLQQTFQREVHHLRGLLNIVTGNSCQGSPEQLSAATLANGIPKAEAGTPYEADFLARTQALGYTWLLEKLFCCACALSACF